MSEMNDDLMKHLDQLSARDSVLQLQARYADAVWRKDLDSFSGCFTAGAEWRIGGSIMRGRDHILVQMTERILPRFQLIRMNLHNPHIDVQPGGYSAHARTFVTENNLRADGTPTLAMGIYFDRMVVEDGVWKFCWRLFQTSYFGPPDMSGDYYDGNPDFGPVPNMPPLDAETINFTGMHAGSGQEQQ